MGKLDEYLNSLEGKENIDPLVIASTMLQLHKEEIGTANAQIAELTGNIESQNATIAEKDRALTEQMAANWRLANQIPADTGVSQGNQEVPETPNDKVGFDKFFKED